VTVLAHIKQNMNERFENSDIKTADVFNPVRPALANLHRPTYAQRHRAKHPQCENV